MTLRSFGVIEIGALEPADVAIAQPPGPERVFQQTLSRRTALSAPLSERTTGVVAGGVDDHPLGEPAEQGEAGVSAGVLDLQIGDARLVALIVIPYSPSAEIRGRGSPATPWTSSPVARPGSCSGELRL